MRKPLEEFVYSEITVMRIVQNRHVRKNTKMPVIVEKCVKEFIRKSIKSSDCRTIKVKLIQNYHGNTWRIRIFDRNKPIQKYTYDDYIQENG
jgi:hypothetical protein